MKKLLICDRKLKVRLFSCNPADDWVKGILNDVTSKSKFKTQTKTCRIKKFMLNSVLTS